MHLPILIPIQRLALLMFALLGTLAHGQTPAPRVEVVASGLQNPWGVAFIDGGRFLVTERPGRLRVVAPDGRLSEPLAGLPPVDAGGQGGLLDVITDRDFARNRTVYFCYAEPAARGSGNSTALAVSVDSPMTAADHVRALHIFAEKNPVPYIARLGIGPKARLRLGAVDQVLDLQESRSA